MIALLPAFAALFFVTVVAGAVADLWAWWLPRHRLNRIFADCRRERVAANVVRLPPVVASSLSARVAVFERCDSGAA